MRESFIALAARGDEHGIATDDGLVRSFFRTRMKGTLPENRLGILKIALDKELDFVVRSSEVEHGHLAAETVKRVIAGGDDAAGGVEYELAIGILLKAGKDVVKNRDFFGEILGFAFGIGEAIRPTHPSRNTVDAGEATRLQDGSEAGLDLIVATHRGTTQSCKIFGPVRFTGTGHADEGEPQRLIRMRPHGELKSVKDAGSEYKK